MAVYQTQPTARQLNTHLISSPGAAKWLCRTRTNDSDYRSSRPASGGGGGGGAWREGAGLLTPRLAVTELAEGRVTPSSQLSERLSARHLPTSSDTAADGAQ